VFLLSLEVTTTNHMFTLLNPPFPTIEISDNVMLVKSKGYNEFVKRRDFGSPLPSNQTLLPWGRKGTSLSPTTVKTVVSPVSLPKRHTHHTHGENSTIPIELLD
jgi:hypothetical protein